MNDKSDSKSISTKIANLKTQTDIIKVRNSFDSLDLVQDAHCKSFVKHLVIFHLIH